MRTPFFWVAAATCLSVAACSGSSNKQGGGAGLPENDSGVEVVPINNKDGGSTTQPDGSTVGPNDGGADGSPLGTLPVPVVDLGDVDGQLPGGSAAEVTPADPNGPLYDRLGAVGSRRFAVSSDGLSFLTFANGGGASSVVSDVVAAAGEGSLVAALVKSGTATSLQRYDENGDTSGGATQLAAATDWQAIAVGSTKTFVVWSHGAALAGGLLDKGGTTVSALDLGSDAAGAGTYAIRIAPSGSGFFVVWTRNRTDKQTETMWRRVESDGTMSATKSLILSSSTHSLVGFTADGSGSALLVDEGAPSFGTVVFRVDASGTIASAVRFVGADHGFGVAAAASGELGIVAQKSGRAAFRAIASDNTAIGPWYLLDDAADAGTKFTPQGAIDGDGTGYAVLAHVTNGAAILRLLDHTGLGL